MGQELKAVAPVLITTTTKLAISQTELADRHLILRRSEDLRGILDALTSGERLLVTGGPAGDEPKWVAPERNLLWEMLALAKSAGAVILVEADGARGRSLKAPAAHEPQIPAVSDLVVPVAGLGALGRPLSEEAVHRPERVRELTGLETGELIQPETFVRLLTSTHGALKGIPSTAEVRILVNQADTPALEGQAQEIASRVLRERRVRAVAIAALADQEPLKRLQGRVGGVVLAAGGSSRLGRVKQLVRWQGRPLVWHAVQAAMQGGCDRVCVVLGANGQAIKESLVGEAVRFVQNPEWESGLSSSIRVGLAELAAEVEAILFLLADMPLVGAPLVGALIEAHATSLAPIVATRVDAQLVNPALFDRATFDALSGLQGDAGGRQLFGRFACRAVEGDAEVLFDVDTPEDLARLEELG
jgi:molybdenum cofactor cytidylyltransferase